MDTRRKGNEMKTLAIICMTVATLLMSGCKMFYGEDTAVSANLYGGGISPKIGPYLAWGTYEVTPDKVTSIRYTRKVTTSVFDSKSHDITESLFVITPNTNWLPNVETIVSAFGPATNALSATSTPSTTSTNSLEALP